MAGQCVERRKCTQPKCKSQSKSFQIFLNDDDSFSGFCFCCKHVDKNPYGDNPPKPGEIHRKTPEEIQAEVDEIRECPPFAVKHRSIDPEDWKHFGVRLIFSEYDGKTPYALAHPYTKGGVITGYKIKLLHTKVMWNVGDVKGADLYGWERAKRVSGGTLFITEGEEDAIALRKILRMMSTAAHYDYAVVSLPAGVNSVAMAIGRMAGEIQSRFKQVVLVYDDDQAGRDAAKETRKILPDAQVAILPEKDANLCLQAGRLKATRDACVFQAAKPKSTNTLCASDIMDDILSDPEWGDPTPWSGINKITYGIRTKELWSIGGGTGCGKTLLGHELAAHDAKYNQKRTLMIMMEETGAETFKSVAGKLDNVPYHVPLEDGQEPYNKDQLRTTVEFLSDYITVWDITTIEDPETTWSQIKSVIRAQGHLFDRVMIDNATTLSEGLNTSERNEFIGKVADEFSKLAVKFDFTAIIFSHLNAPPKGQKSHENGGKVLESQFTGSRALQRYSHMMFGFERNKMAVDPDCSLFRVLKNRKYGKTGYIKTYYTQRTGRLQQKNWEDDLYKDKQVGKST
jgi:twinkle protein